MATVVLRIKIDDTLADRWFEYAGHKIRDAREPLRDVMHQVVWPAVKGQLDSQGSRSGEPWQELSEQYGEWKDLHYPGEPILRLTRDMEKALFAPDSYRASGSRLIYNPHDEKLEWHQTGAPERKPPLPKRVVVALTVDDDEQIDRIFTAWLDELRTANIRRGNDLFQQDIPDHFIL